MGKSIRTTSNTQTPTNSTLATFKAGDTVLCPFVGTDSYQLFIDDKHGLLSFIAGVNKYHIQADGKQDPSDKSPLIFHDTLENRHIITALSGQATPTTSQRKIIDTTEADDKEAILISAFDLRDIACDINSAATFINDMGQLLALIHYEKLEGRTVRSMARLGHSTADTWEEILHSLLDRINKTLEQTTYGKEGE